MIALASLAQLAELLKIMTTTSMLMQPKMWLCYLSVSSRTYMAQVNWVYSEKVPEFLDHSDQWKRESVVHLAILHCCNHSITYSVNRVGH